MHKLKKHEHPKAQTLDELSRKILQMEDSAIQSFNSADWLYLYEKINELSKKPKVQKKILQYHKQNYNEEIYISNRQIAYLNMMKAKENVKLKTLLNKQEALPEQDRDFEALNKQKEKEETRLNILLNKQKNILATETTKNVNASKEASPQLQIKEQDKENLSKEIAESQEKINSYTLKIAIYQNIITSKENIEDYEKQIKTEEANIKEKEALMLRYEEHLLQKNHTCLSNIPRLYTEMFAKLYCNYRFSKDVYNYLTTMGKLIGQRLASTNINTSELALNIGDKRGIYANTISKEVLETLFHGASSYQGAEHPVLIEKISENGAASAENIKITNRIQDNLLKTIIHECIHIYGQAKKKTYSRYLYNEHQYPLSDDKNIIISQEIIYFYKVLMQNECFYGNKDDFKALNLQKAYKTYKGQPYERMANLVATIAERTYMQKTNQGYERNSIDLYNYTHTILGAPENIIRKGDTIIHRYKATDKLTIDKVKETFKDMDYFLQKELNITEEAVGDDKFISYSVKENWSFRSKLLEFIKQQKRKKSYQNATKKIMKQRAKQK